MKNLLVCAAMLCAAALPAADGPSADAPRSVKIGIAGVAAVADDGDDGISLDGKGFSAPGRRVVVKPGQNAALLVDYEVPANVKSRIWVLPNCAEEGVGGCFGTGGSPLHEGKGRTYALIHLEPADIKRPVLLKSVKMLAEIEGEDERWCGSERVNIVFTNGGDFGESDLEVLEPLPPPPASAAAPRAKKAPPAPGSSVPAGFTDNLDEALSRAKSSGKYVYACFSGSDWCGWCMKLEREVFSTRDFIDGVAGDYELVFLDYPSNENVLSEHAKKANPGLAERYGIRGYPTALIMDGEGRVLGTTGYRKGGGAEYARHLMEFRQKKSGDPVK